MVELVAIMLQQFAVAGEHWPVNHPVTEVEEEGLVFAVFHELESGFRDAIVGIGDPFRLGRAEWRISFLAERIGFIIGSREILGAIAHAAVHAAILMRQVEAIVGGGQADVPFADMTGAVAAVGKGGGEGERVKRRVGI